VIFDDRAGSRSRNSASATTAICDFVSKL